MVPPPGFISPSHKPHPGPSVSLLTSVTWNDAGLSKGITQGYQLEGCPFPPKIPNVLTALSRPCSRPYKQLTHAFPLGEGHVRVPLFFNKGGAFLDIGLA